MFENRRWLVIPTSLTETIDFNQVLESSIDTLRVSVDGTKTFVKYEITEVLESYSGSSINPDTGNEVIYTVDAGVYGRPSIYSEEYNECNHSEILTLLSTEEWSNPIDTL